MSVCERELRPLPQPRVGVWDPGSHVAPPTGVQADLPPRPAQRGVRLQTQHKAQKQRVPLGRALCVKDPSGSLRTHLPGVNSAATGP